MSMSGWARRSGSRRVVAGVVVAVVASGLWAVPSSGAAEGDRGRRRNPSELPALESERPAARRVERPVGDSSSRRHVKRERSASAKRSTAEFRAMSGGPPPITSPVSPADGAVVNTTTPVLQVSSVTDPESDTVGYRFKVTTGSDAESGTVVADTTISGTSFTIPDGALKDGVTYFWHTYTTDPTNVVGTAPGWVRSFRVDLRLGVRKTFPFDTEGPASVNLATGNLVLGASSWQVNTLAGPLGLSLTYNHQTPTQPGLLGSYTADANASRTVDGSEAPAVIRRDPSINFDWGTGSPSPGLPSTNVVARWTGYVTSPVSTGLYFGAATSDGVKITVDGTQVVNSWTTQTANTPIYGSSVNLNGNSPVPITIDWFKGSTPGSFLRLYVKSTDGTTIPEALVPPSWLSMSAPALPNGWVMSPTGGSGLSVVRAEVSESRVVLVGADLSTHVYTSTGTGYTPPKGEDGVLARDAKGKLTFAGGDGVTYVFDAAGALQSAMSSSGIPSAHRYAWTTPSGSSLPRLTTITDPVSQRDVTVRYGGDSSCPGSAPSGFDNNAPAGMVCSIEFWDGNTTKLWYSSGRLARIQNPGDAITDFAYDSSNRITKIRDSLAADMIGATLRADDDTTRTLITYDTNNRVTQVQLAEPNTGDARPAHTYTYTSSTETRVSVAGLTQPHGFASKVTFDSNGRQLTATDATNLTSSMTWNDADQPTSATDAAGLKSTTIYDHVGRPIETYGPAPSAWFGTDFKPLMGYVAQVPKNTTAYDGGMNSLDAVFFNNTTWSGDPAAHTPGVGGPSGAIAGSWSNSTPVAGITNSNSWSARFTGEINLANTGTYTFAPNAGGIARLYIDDTLVVDGAVSSSGTFNNTVVGKHRVRMEFTTALSGPVPQQQVIGFTGASQAWTVPTGVSSLTVTARGAEGGQGGSTRYGGAGGGLGGYAQSTISVTAGESLTVAVGGKPAPASGTTGASVGGWPDGAAGGTGYVQGSASGAQPGAAGGGGTRLSRGSTTLVVAGGGGGAGGGGDQDYGGGMEAGVGMPGGSGGGATGSTGTVGGFAPQQSQAGPAGAGGAAGVGGSAGSGGSATYSSGAGGGGGGGGGATGGGGGASGGGHYYVWWFGPLPAGGSGGGGGSSWASGSSTSYSGSGRSGNGELTLNWTASVLSTWGLDLHWTPPGGTDQQVPGSALTPRYGLPTKSTDADGRMTDTQYASPALGLPTAQVVDPAGLALTTATSYESWGSGFLRPLSRQLPKGASTAVTTTYYGATEARSNPCASGSAVNQAGMSKTTTDAAGISREQVLDASGRVIASRVVGDSGWSCLTFDARGRLTQSVDRLGGATSVNYASPGTATSTYPDSAGASRTTTTTADLLGRAASYTDELGTRTRAVYDQSGRVTDSYRMFAGQSEAHLGSTTFDAAGRILTHTEYLSSTGRTTTFSYDGAGRQVSSLLPNGAGNENAFDNLGRVSRISNLTPVGNSTASQTFSYVGASPQSWTAPSWVTAATVQAWGAQGGNGGGGGGGSNNPGGLGGRERARVSVTPGETLAVRVGGQGVNGPLSTGQSSGGYNGGATGGYAATGNGGGGGGGGASDVFRGSTALVVAGGGGGAGSTSSSANGHPSGGAGGGVSGGAGVSVPVDPNTFAGGPGSGAGGTSSAGGTGGTTNYSSGDGWGQPGTSGNGGAGGQYSYGSSGGGGGGGGYYGGGGGAGDYGNPFSGSGGGGSGFIQAGATDVQHEAGVRGGNGQVVVSWTVNAVPSRGYSYSLGGRVLHETQNGAAFRAYTYDVAGRLKTTVEGSTTRNYAYDANSNRCGLATSCDGNWAYDNADRITASPYASSYTYDSHGNMTASVGRTGYPSASINYDAHDHATVMNDGTTTVTETLAPSGRVLRRVVTTNATSAVTEDTSFGYSGGDDSPAYSRPTAGGTVTTYVDGPDGLLAIDVGGTAKYPLYNLHGDVLGTTDGSGAYSAVPTTDEFGVGTPSADRLGWTGDEQRYSTGAGLNLIRMGVRLYDPLLGRFLQVDPILGGSANDYEFCSGDPVNCFDLGGTHTQQQIDEFLRMHARLTAAQKAQFERDVATILSSASRVQGRAPSPPSTVDVLVTQNAGLPVYPTGGGGLGTINASLCGGPCANWSANEMAYTCCGSRGPSLLDSPKNTRWEIVVCFWGACLGSRGSYGIGMDGVSINVPVKVSRKTKK
jgi:RHS repeat-associated protein